jgi:hypothetical protein
MSREHDDRNLPQEIAGLVDRMKRRVERHRSERQTEDSQ